MGPLSRFRLRLTTLLVMGPNAALAMAGGEGAAYVGFILFLVKLASGAVMARLAISASGGSARSGALQAAAGRVPHARPAAASALSRGKAMGTGGGSCGKMAASGRA